MAPKRCRAFTLLDLLLLIAAVGLGLAWTRHYQHTEQGFESYPVPDEVGGFVPARFFPNYRLAVILWWIVGLYHCVAVVTMALLALRLRRPHARLRRLTCQPGTVACAAVTLAVCVEMIEQIPSAIQSYLLGGQPWWDVGHLAYWDMDGPYESVAVAAVWLLMVSSRRWKREPGWIDGFGIILGAFWLITPPIIWLLST